jgi:hypothetical protein
METGRNACVRRLVRSWCAVLLLVPAAASSTQRDASFMGKRNSRWDWVGLPLLVPRTRVELLSEMLAFRGKEVREPDHGSGRKRLLCSG